MVAADSRQAIDQKSSGRTRSGDGGADEEIVLRTGEPAKCLLPQFRPQRLDPEFARALQWRVNRTIYFTKNRNIWGYIGQPLWRLLVRKKRFHDRYFFDLGTLESYLFRMSCKLGNIRVLPRLRPTPVWRSRRLVRRRIELVYSCSRFLRAWTVCNLAGIRFRGMSTGGAEEGRDRRQLIAIVT